MNNQLACLIINWNLLTNDKDQNFFLSPSNKKVIQFYPTTNMANPLFSYPRITISLSPPTQKVTGDDGNSVKILRTSAIIFLHCLFRQNIN